MQAAESSLNIFFLVVLKLGEGGRVRSWEYEGEEKKVGRGEKKVARGAGIATSTSALPSVAQAAGSGLNILFLCGLL